MVKKVTIYSAILTVVFAAVGCLGDNIESLYSICMGLCCTSLVVFIAGLLLSEFSPYRSENPRTRATEKKPLKRIA